MRLPLLWPRARQPPLRLVLAPQVLPELPRLAEAGSGEMRRLTKGMGKHRATSSSQAGAVNPVIIVS